MTASSFTATAGVCWARSACWRSTCSAATSFGKNIDNLSKAFDDRVILLPEIDAGNQIVLAFSGPRLAVTPAELLGRAAIVEARYGLPARRWARALTAHAVDGVLHL